MNVLVGCEFSGVVREAFKKRGHNAWSCDLLPAADGSAYHIQGDVLAVLDGFDEPAAWPGGIKWDLAIFHPPCTHLAVSGAHLSVLPNFMATAANGLISYCYLGHLFYVAKHINNVAVAVFQLNTVFTPMAGAT